MSHEEAKKEDERRERVGGRRSNVIHNNFVKELTRLKEMRLENPGLYSGLLNPIIMQAEGKKEYIWGQKFEPKREFSGWTAEDCQELLKDLGEEIWLGGIKNKSESAPAEEK